MLNNEEYYLNLSLPPTPKPPPTQQSPDDSGAEQSLFALIDQLGNKDEQEKLKAAAHKLIVSYTEKNQSLRHALEDIQESKKQLQCRLNTQSQQFDRSLRETQHYKSLYEALKASRRRSTVVSSSASCLSGKSFTSCSTRSSTSSSMRYSLIDEVIDPVLIDRQLVIDSDTEDHSTIDLYSVLSESESSTLPVSPTITPAMSPIPENNVKNQDSFSTPPEQVLTFACGDGFWNTIANGKQNKPEVDMLVSNYLRRGGNPNVAKNSDTVKNVKEGYSLIHALIAIKNTAALQKVIDAGAKTNVYPLTSKREDKITPIVLAAKIGYMNGIRLLFERAGADLLNARGPYGENALHAAVQSDSDEMVGYLLRLCRNKLLETPDNNGATPLHYACITGKTRLITLFIRDCHAQPDPKDSKGETPLHYAVRNRKLKVVAKLVGDLGVYPNPYVYKQVPTPLDLAKAGGLRTIADYLKRMGAKTTKELEKASRTASNSQESTNINSSDSSILSGESNISADSATHTGVRQYLHTKTSQILKGTFDL